MRPKQANKPKENLHRNAALSFSWPAGCLWFKASRKDIVTKVPPQAGGHRTLEEALRWLTWALSPHLQTEHINPLSCGSPHRPTQSNSERERELGRLEGKSKKLSFGHMIQCSVLTEISFSLPEKLNVPKSYGSLCISNTRGSRLLGCTYSNLRFDCTTGSPQEECRAS